MNRRVVPSVIGTVVLFLLVQLGAIALVAPFRSAGYQPVSNPSDPTNSLLYLAGVLVATGVMLAAIRFELRSLVRLFIIGASVFLCYYVFSVFVPPFIAPGGVHALAIALAGGCGIVLWVHPEWYVIDAIGAVIGMAAAGLFGISLGIVPALLLLCVLAVYDAISVYKTEHMLTLAEGLMALKIPIVLVIPLTRSYSFLTAEDEDQPDRDALYIGLGDAVMPSILVASSIAFLPVAPIIDGLVLTVPALFAMGGTIAGLLVLIKLVLAGRAHAGLPLLNGCTIVGYFVGALISGVSLLEAAGV
ncbi:presenilin family intramembrane aspartyl protease PSH [Halocatena halophila]|uniref:presenilin family intramembrane aspartyl protease PSH n=1 Tax=Halocatena halophila TaxID=2814576 RepID=UPI002ED4D5A0